MRILLALLLITLLPAAQALTVSEPESLPALMPDEAYPIAFSVTVPCPAVIRQALPGAAATLTVTPTTPAGFSITGPHTYAVSRDGCTPTESRVVEVTFNVTASMQAPARQEANLVFDVQLGDDPEEAEEFTVTLIPASKVVFEASTAMPMKQAGPQKTISYQIDIKYRANDLVAFRFSTNGTDNGQLILPDEIRGGSGNGSVTATAHYATPSKNGPNNAQANFQVIVQAFSTVDDTLFSTQAVDFTAKTRGVYVPGPTALLPAGLLLAAFLRRR